MYDRRTLLRSGVAVGALATAGCLGSDGGSGDGNGAFGDAESAEFAVETVVDGLDEPWGFAFLPDGDHVLVTEIRGSLLLVDRHEGTTDPVEGVPNVHAVGQGGLLDVAIHPEFPDEDWIYLTYAATDDNGASTTHVARGRLDRNEGQLDDVETLHAAEPFVDSTSHYGSRAVFGEDGRLYVTVGDRAFKDFGPDHVSQDRTNELGAVLRLEPDGSIPEDNPFVDDPDAADAIFSYGHRNNQGLTVHPETGDLWTSEHGERDGDEINVLEAGGNFGWPIATYGCEYGTEEPVGDQPHDREDVVVPVYYWECTSGGFPPAGAAFYDGDAFPEWQGDLFVGNLAGRYLGRFTVDDPGADSEVEEVEPLLVDRGWRVRDVEVAPDSGHLYVVVDAADAPLVRLVPE